MIGSWAALAAARAAVRVTFRILASAAAAALLIAALPVSAVASAAAAAAWLRGWPPRRLYHAALWCAPMVAVWLAATALEDPAADGSALGAAPGSAGWRIAAAPYRAWLAMWHLGAAGSIAAAAAVVAPGAIPLGLAAGALAWSYRIRSMETGAGGLSPARRSPSTCAAGAIRRAVRRPGSPRPAQYRSPPETGISWPVPSSGRSATRPGRPR